MCTSVAVLAVEVDGDYGDDVSLVLGINAAVDARNH